MSYLKDPEGNKHLILSMNFPLLNEKIVKAISPDLKKRDLQITGVLPCHDEQVEQKMATEVLFAYSYYPTRESRFLTLKVAEEDPNSDLNQLPLELNEIIRRLSCEL